MPPKKKAKAKKVVDEETLRKMMGEWKETEEFTMGTELGMKKKLFPDITETTPDLTGDWQTLENDLFKYAQILKVKSKLKELRHEHIRSFFFAQEDKEDEVIMVDGILSGVTKEHSDRSWHLRKKFIDIMKDLDEMQEVDEFNFQAFRKKLAKDFTDLFKQMVGHIKNGHPEIYGVKLEAVLTPLKNLLNSNWRLSLYENNYDDEDKKTVTDFRHKVLVDKFCEHLQECFRILYDVEKDREKRVMANPETWRIIMKLNYENWRNNSVEKFYLTPLNNAYFKLRVNLYKLYIQGQDYWKTPLSLNSVFLDDCKELIAAELIANHLLGDELKRDQINFTFEILKRVYETPAKEKLLRKDESMLKTSIPMLLAFKSMERMIVVQDKRKENEEMIETRRQEIRNSGTLKDSNLQKSMLSKNTATKTMSSTLINAQDDYIKLMEADFEKELRYWYWENYAEDEYLKKFELGASMVRDINPAVRQDIEDYIITEGLLPRFDDIKEREKNKETLREARKFLEKLREDDTKKDEINNKRPPALWNHPEIVESEHKYRSIAAPQECYVDMRVQALITLLEELGSHLFSHEKIMWKVLISRTIDVFVDRYIEKPDLLIEIPEKKEEEEEGKEREEKKESEENN